jgi:hypothetical protein
LGTPVFSTDKTYRENEMLLKVALSTITHNPNPQIEITSFPNKNLRLFIIKIAKIEMRIII